MVPLPRRANRRNYQPVSYDPYSKYNEGKKSPLRISKIIQMHLVPRDVLCGWDDRHSNPVRLSKNLTVAHQTFLSCFMLDI